jgi:multiple antibiotic resistance protein
MDYLNEFLLAFIPLFVAIDPIGLVPVVVGLTEESNSRERLRVINIAMLMALSLGLAFLAGGNVLLRYLGVEVAYFTIAGGLVLLIIAVRDLVGAPRPETPNKGDMIAIVPIGTPLTAGPATLATILLLADRYTDWVVGLAFVANIAVAFVLFVSGTRIVGLLGQGGMKAFAKIASLLLAAIAVRMIVTGLETTLVSGSG